MKGAKFDLISKLIDEKLQFYNAKHFVSGERELKMRNYEKEVINKLKQEFLKL